MIILNNIPKNEAKEILGNVIVGIKKGLQNNQHISKDEKTIITNFKKCQKFFKNNHDKYCSLTQNQRLSYKAQKLECENCTQEKTAMKPMNQAQMIMTKSPDRLRKNPYRKKQKSYSNQNQNGNYLNNNFQSSNYSQRNNQQTIINRSKEVIATKAAAIITSKYIVSQIETIIIKINREIYNILRISKEQVKLTVIECSKI